MKLLSTFTHWTIAVLFFALMTTGTNTRMALTAYGQDSDTAVGTLDGSDQPSETAPDADGNSADGNSVNELAGEPLPEEDRSLWQHMATLKLPADKHPDSAAADIPPSGMADLIITPEIFSKARPDLADIRLFDSQNKIVPYALRILRPESLRERLITTEFNRTELDGGGLELTLDLQTAETEHSEVEIQSEGEEFRRRTVIDGSDDGTSWRRLAAENLLRFERNGQKVEVNTIQYPVSRFRYVRVQVFPDPEVFSKSTSEDPEEKPGDVIDLRDIAILRETSRPGEKVTHDAILMPREPGRLYGTASSSWIIELGGSNIPCDSLEIDVENSEFNRDVEVLAEMPSYMPGRTQFQPVAIDQGAQWQRRLGDPGQPIVITFSEVQTGRLKLVVSDHSNIPLRIRGVRYSAPARQLIFSQPAQDAQALSLYCGNPEVYLPQYDYERNLGNRAIIPEGRIAVGTIQQNPAYLPPPAPLSERFPWLIYLVLGMVTAVLAYVISSVARTAIAIHDAAGQPGVQ